MSPLAENDPNVFRRDCFKRNCATTLFNQRDSALVTMLKRSYAAIAPVGTLDRLVRRVIEPSVRGGGQRPYVGPHTMATG